jgi:hypothetical protein
MPKPLSELNADYMNVGQEIQGIRERNARVELDYILSTLSLPFIKVWWQSKWTITTRQS